MPEAAAAGDGRGGGQEGNNSMMWKVAQGLVMYFGMNMLMKQFVGNKPQSTTTNTATDAAGNTIQVTTTAGDIPAFQDRPDKLDEGAMYNQIPQRIAPIWPVDSNIDILVTLSDTFHPIKIASIPQQYVALKEKDFKLGDLKDSRVAEITFDVPKAVQNNGTLWGHFYIGQTGANLDPLEQGFDPATAAHFAFPLTHFFPKKKIAKTRNLLEDKVEEEEPEQEEELNGPVIANYYHPNTTLSFVDLGVVQYPTMHPVTRRFVHLEATGARDGSGQNSWYYPTLFVNSFWQMRSQMTVLNDTVTSLPMRLDLNNLRAWQFHLMATIDASSKQQAHAAAFAGPMQGGSDGSEIELVKEVLFDSNPYLLGITVVVSIAHIFLEMLAFGSDIAHYRKKKDNVGISVRSILANVFMQTVIFLYLVDNSQNTSWMILGSQAVGILIEFWKITTVVDVKFGPAPAGSLLPYKITFEDKGKLSETEEKTKEYDEIAFRYMYMAGVPLLLAYAVYSLVYDSHKSWYSYIISTLVGSVYAYGFLLMVPSLYINYRLKSVAHMPGKAMMYKFLNTFIDDLFAFTIKMPILHRLATFRDDIIFFIYIYQRWAYKVDHTRVNEFGQGGEDDEEPEPRPKSMPDAEKIGKEIEAEGKTTGASAKGDVKKRK